MNKDETIEFIHGLEREDISPILFNPNSSVLIQNISFKQQKRIKFTWDEETVNKNIEYLSETLTNIITLKTNNSFSILFKSIDSTGYDGAFLICKEGKWDFWISETKSSNREYDISNNNEKIYKQNEALGDVLNKMKRTLTDKESSSREEDNGNLWNGLVVLQSTVSKIPEKQIETLSTSYNKLISGEHNKFVAATLSKPSNGKIPKSSNWDKNEVIETFIVLDTLNDVKEINEAFLARLEAIYG